MRYLYAAYTAATAAMVDAGVMVDCAPLHAAATFPAGWPLSIRDRSLPRGNAFLRGRRDLRKEPAP